MLKKIFMAAAAVVFVLSLTACNAKVDPLPTLSVPEQSSSSGEGSAEGAEFAVKAEDCEDTLEGLCEFLEGNGAVTGDKVEMSYKEIGAVGGYRYKFLYNGGSVQVEVYEFDRNNLDERAQKCLSSVEKDGEFTILDNVVPATISDNGKYLLIYTDSRKEELNLAQKEKATEMFRSFHA